MHVCIASCTLHAQRLTKRLTYPGPADCAKRLNKKASAGRAPSAYKGINGICNELAGTTGKSAVDALRTI